MTSWFLLLLAAGLPAPVPAADPDVCPGEPACVAISALPAEGAPRAATLIARDASGRRQATALPSLDACLALAQAYQQAHPDAAEDVACEIR